MLGKKKKKEKKKTAVLRIRNEFTLHRKPIDPGRKEGNRANLGSYINLFLSI